MEKTENQASEILSRFRVVLCRPSHTGNMGSAARAMKTMGITRLYLVAPQRELDAQAEALASGATDVLQAAKHCETLDQALHGVHFAVALSSRKRELASPLFTPKDGMAHCLAAARSGQEIALVFGNEKFGLSIEELDLCNMLVTIAGNPDYFSLNLAQAVQVLCYEIYQQLDQDLSHLLPDFELATRDQCLGFYAHLEQTLKEIGFFERRKQDRLMRRLHSLFDRAQLQREEIDILRGFLNKVSQLNRKEN